MLRLLCAIVLIAAFTQAACADLLQTGQSRWVVLASAQDVDNVIGIAELYALRFDEVHVVEASNGWFAVIGGPVPIPKGIKAAREGLNTAADLPKDLFLSNGQNFARTVWSPPGKSDLPIWTYRGGKPLVIFEEGLEITVSESLEGNIRFPAIELKRDGKVLLKEIIKGSEFFGEKMNAEVQIAWLDRTAPTPQIIFSSYWNGAHCCTVTRILTNRGTEWVSVEAQTLDGGGYQLRDLDGNGDIELLSVDNSFFYKFASYAGSWAPLAISKLRGSQLVDQRWSSDFRRYYRRALFGWEFQAKLEPSLWRQNGFLGGWLALKSVLGESDQAWSVLLSKYDRSEAWPLTICDAAMQNGECPKEATRQVDFPEALRDHLRENGYLGPQANEAEEPPAPPPSTVAVSTPVGAPAPITPKESPVISSGTGFFVSAQGHLVTNHHVIKGCTAIEVRRTNSLVREASVLAEDPTNDLALLRVEGDTGAYASVRVETRLGEAVAAFGYPLSQVLASGGNFTLGNVTALAGLRNDTRFIQISAPVQPGNSGGPLLDSYGNVIGVVTSKLDVLLALTATGDIPQNVNFALRGSSLYAFLITYGITPTVSSTDSKLDAPDLADRASSFSAAITCR